MLKLAYTVEISETKDMRIMLAGQIGRDAAIATRLAAEGCELHIAAEFNNPTLVEKAQNSGGEFYLVPSIRDPSDMGRMATYANVDLLWSNSDEALASGIVDEVRSQAPGVLMASPDRESARVEWDKFDSRDIIAEIDAEWGTSYNPRYQKVTTAEQVAQAIDYYQMENTEVAIKPRGLSGGKGVKVMGPHLNDHGEALDYATRVVADPAQGGAVIEEKLFGYEFTIQGITDGKTLIAPPATYDYPYREDGDKGPGTGGMGCYTMPSGEQLPFLNEADYDEAIEFMNRVLVKMNERGRDFKGVQYGSFFKTAKGLKCVEFNARIGDPEGINIVELLENDVSLTNILERIAKQELRPEDVRFKKLASTVIYLVSPDYAYRKDRSFVFEVDEQVIAAHGCRTYFAAAEQIGRDRYRTVGASRTLAIATLDKTPGEGRARIHEAIKAGSCGPLQYRRDVAGLSI